MGGVGVMGNTNGNPGIAPGGGGGGASFTNWGVYAGGGGSGGYLQMVYTTATLPPGTTISSIVVGAGGSGAPPGTWGATGANGGVGQVSITCSNAGAPTYNDQGILYVDNGQYTTNTNFVYNYNTGNVGIGTTSPGSALDVKGAIRVEGSTSGYLGFQAPATVTTPVTWTLPNGDGSYLQVLQTNGSGTLAWASVPVSGGSNTVAAGSAGAPSLNFTGDTTTGFYDASAGTIGISASGSNILSLSSGNIAGSGALTVAAGGTNQNLTLKSSGTGSINIASGNGTSLSVLDGGASTVNYVTMKGSAAAGTPVIATAGSDTNINVAIMPKGTGQVGIGTTSPVAALDVNGGVRVGTTAATCSSTTKGTIRYNTTSNTMEFCNGTGWNLLQAAACSTYTPTVFTFTNLGNQSTSTLVTSEIIQITGINCLVPTSISGPGSPAYRICSDSGCSTVVQDWTTGTSSLSSGQYIQSRQTTSVSGGVTNNAALIIGGGATVWGAATTGDCASSPSIGTVCTDGSVYAGLSPDTNVAMYAQRCDQGQTWNGTTCTGTRSNITWNNGTSTWIFEGYNNNTTGRANTTALAALADGASPHAAAQTCENLNEDGHTDWYLPSLSELNVLYQNNGYIGYFNTTGTYYWSSTEYNISTAWIERFSDGSQNTNFKYTTYLVRCVRR